MAIVRERIEAEVKRDYEVKLASFAKYEKKLAQKRALRNKQETNDKTDLEDKKQN
jgi:hypothetical protein